MNELLPALYDHLEPVALRIAQRAAALEPADAQRAYLVGVARQIAKHTVTINNLLPGTVMTERIKELGETANQLIARVPAGRGGLPEEFGAACAFLCSGRASYITGQNLLVDGGLCSFTV